MQLVKLLTCFCGLLWSTHAMATTDNDRNRAADQAGNAARTEKESSAVPSAPGDIKFVKHPKLGVVINTGLEF